MNDKAFDDVRDVEITDPPIELFVIMKLQGMAQSGGEAKYFISEGLVTVNGEVETRKRKKIFPGDVVEFNHELIRVIEKQ